jgi:hypothetical protein
MNDNGEKLTFVAVRSEGDGGWGWPSNLVFTLRREDGTEIEAFVDVVSWQRPERAGMAKA